ncbi:MAG: hypothetical protein OEM91_11125 [Hyphomicrobiales bacterium]|nr:hypothetical protein [Hyphomicrobiales bacterium]
MGEGGYLLLVVVAQRLAELILARRNTAKLLARGGREVGASHYPAFIVLHGSWLVLLFLVARDAEVSIGWLTAYVLLQFARLWVLVSLGERWTTRIVVVDEPLVRTGPYRFVDHPNYLVVAAEFIVVPMALQQPWVAVVYSVLNAAVLFVRIKAEAAALSSMKA